MLASRALFVVLLAGSALIPFACSVKPTYLKEDGGSAGGAGGARTCTDLSDCGDAGDCFTWKCENQMCVQENVQAKTLCQEGKKCNGRGDCVACIEDADCPPSGMLCYVSSCNSAGECKLVPASAGPAPPDQQTPGDCVSITCDASGHPSDTPDPQDFDDQSICTTDSCDVNMKPVHTPINNGEFCDDCFKCSDGECVLICSPEQVCKGNNMCGAP